MCQAPAGNFLAGLHWKRQRAASCSSKMISFSNINRQYGKQLLFVDASFQLHSGEKVGLVGPNGAGKTTLFRMVVGEETPDKGAVSFLKTMSPSPPRPLDTPATRKSFPRNYARERRARVSEKP